MGHVFGPVPSRRLGRSIGVNNIPPKVCSYSCVYCQLGRAIEMTAERRRFFDPQDLCDETRAHLEAARRRGEEVDYLTIVPDGEPTLDRGLGSLISCLKDLGERVALISNASLVADPQVRQELAGLDWLSLKLDAATPAVWKRIDRPHRRIDFAEMLNGMRLLAAAFEGTLTTETMLVEGVNDGIGELERIAGILAELHPYRSYISVPTRPPAMKWVRPASEEVVARACALFTEAGLHTETLIGYEGTAFAASGDAREDILSITAVHPLRHDAMEQLLERDGAGSNVLGELLQTGKVVRVEYGDHAYYIRAFRR
ncbi:MAG: radical SAM protein [Spirochaetaceae bacterium]